METKQLRKIFYIVREVFVKLPWIILVALMCGIAAYIFKTETYEPTYVCSVNVAVKSKGSTSSAYSSLTEANSFAGTFELVIQSSELKALILKDTGWNSIPGDIRTMIIENTNIIELSATASDPLSAFQYMQAILKNYPKIVNEISGITSLVVLRAPVVPTHASSSSGASRAAVIAAILGAAAMIALFAFISYSNPLVDSAAYVKDNMNTVLLDTLPFEGKNGLLRSVFQKKEQPPILISGIGCSPAYVESIKNIRTTVLTEKKDGQSLAVLVSSSVMNEGKSTVAANLALSMAELKMRVALVDFDTYNPSLMKSFPKRAASVNKIDDFIFSTEGFSGSTVKLDYSTGIMMFFGTPGQKSRRTFPITAAARFINWLRGFTDIIIIDTPPITLFADAPELADYTDVSMIVVREHLATEDQIMNSISTLRDGSSKFIGCVYNGERFSSKTAAHSYGYGKYGYGKYGYGYGKYGYGYGKYGYGKNAYKKYEDNDETDDEDEEDED